MQKLGYLQDFAALQTKSPNIIFLMEAKRNGALPFLDIKIYKKNGKPFTSIKQKDAFSRSNRNFFQSHSAGIQVCFVIHPFLLVVLLHFILFKISDAPFSLVSLISFGFFQVSYGT